MTQGDSGRGIVDYDATINDEDKLGMAREVPEVEEASEDVEASFQDEEDCLF